MADWRLTKVGLPRALVLCVFGAFSPRRLIEAEQTDNETRKQFPQPPPPKPHSAFRLRWAFWASLLWVLGSIVAGYLIGKILAFIIGPPPTYLVRVLQVVGAAILLWATLFVRGWDIQTYGGVSLTERVNQWIYRSLYCLGTTVIVVSLAVV